MRVLLTFCLIFPLLAHAKDPVSPQEQTETFLSSIQHGNISEGYDRLFEGSQIPSAKPQAISMLKQQTKGGLPLYGKIIGFEKVKEEKFGNSILRFVYVLKSETHPTIWEFYFYQPKKSWFLINVKFNDQFDLLK